jgi:hypothetical protein
MERIVTDKPRWSREQAVLPSKKPKKEKVEPPDGVAREQDSPQKQGYTRCLEDF